MTKRHTQAICEQQLSPLNDTRGVESERELRNICSAERRAKEKEEREEVDRELKEEQLNFVRQARDKGASSWLNAVPLKEQGLNLNKQEFRDALRLRYNLRLKNLPSFCACGEKYEEFHALSCKKGGFVALRHDSIKGLFISLLNKVCKGVKSEPHLIPLDNETFLLKSANISEEARLDIKAHSFWRQGQNALFDIRVTHVNCSSSKGQSTMDIFRNHENAKKREYLKRVLEVEHATFTPLVMGTNGGMGDECKQFVSHLADLLAEKQGEDYNTVICWIRTKLSFEILRSALLCVRGSRSPWKQDLNEILIDFKLNSVEAQIS